MGEFLCGLGVGFPLGGLIGTVLLSIILDVRERKEENR